jgi:hypothetical protein
MEDCAAAVATAKRTGHLESKNSFVYVNAAENEILNAEARQLNSVEYRCRASETCIAVVETKEEDGHRNM